MVVKKWQLKELEGLKKLKRVGSETKQLFDDLIELYTSRKIPMYATAEKISRQLIGTSRQIEAGRKQIEKYMDKPSIKGRLKNKPKKYFVKANIELVTQYVDDKKAQLL